MINAVVLNDTGSYHFGCSAVMEHLRKGLCRHGFSIIGSVPYNQSWKSKPYIDLVEQADIILVNGEGTLHSSRPRVIDLLSVTDLACIRQVPCALVNTTYQNNNQICAEYVKRFDFVSCRESLSKQELLKIRDQVFCCPDLSIMEFKWLQAQNDARRSNFDYVVYTDSVIRETSDTLHDKSKQDIDSLFLTLNIDRPPAKGLKNKLLYLIKSYSPQIYNQGAMIDIGPHSFCPSISDLIKVTSGARGIVTGRFHMVCLAMALEIPFVATPSNTWKIESMLHDAGMGRFLVSQKNIKSLRSENLFTAPYGAQFRYVNVAENRANELFLRLTNLV